MLPNVFTEDNESGSTVIDKSILVYSTNEDLYQHFINTVFKKQAVSSGMELATTRRHQTISTSAPLKLQAFDESLNEILTYQVLNIQRILDNTLLTAKDNSRILLILGDPSNQHHFDTLTSRKINIEDFDSATYHSKKSIIDKLQEQLLLPANSLRHLESSRNTPLGRLFHGPNGITPMSIPTKRTCEP